MKHTRKLIGAAALLAALALMAPQSQAADEPEVKWDHVFSGHEMWLTSLDSGLAVSAREGRPMLVDFYSRH
ncbi:MAG: hypothetical protein HZB43_02440 [candidate division Zixibacteria bacterium]|nr:hypothetical protein [candidate division Zixibacteria bacterium]